MPRKVRELESDLHRAGFDWRPGKGSHRKWRHPLLQGGPTTSGNPGVDAQRYQEDLIREWMRRARASEEDERWKTIERG